MARRCVAASLPGCALTEHGNLSGAVSFISAMSEKELKPIIGCELYICQNDITLKDATNKSYNHLLVLARNLEGWQRLFKLVSVANLGDHFYYKPRLDLATLAKWATGDNLVGFSGHLGSTLCDCVFADLKGACNAKTIEEAKTFVRPDWGKIACDHARLLESIFGKGNFFIEIQLIDGEHLPCVQLLAQGLRWVSRQTGIPCIGTPDAHYAAQEDAIDQRVLLCSSMNTTFNEIAKKTERGEDVGLGGFFRSRNYYIPSYEDMIRFGNTEEELQNTLLIAEMCETYSLKHKPRLPKVGFPDSFESSADYLKHLCDQGWTDRLKYMEQNAKDTNRTLEDYRARRSLEEDTLVPIGLADYFLIVHDLVNYARKDGQLTGAGRGSAAGCLMLYLLGITSPQVDPLKYDLLLSRFYNAGRNTPGKVSMPDVDMDFERGGREKIINYIRTKYGKNNVAQIITFSRLQGRGALKEVLRVHGACGFDEMNEITKHIPDESKISDQLEEMRKADIEDGGEGDVSIIEWALENNSKKLQEWAFYDGEGNLNGPMAKFFAQAIRIEGTIKSQGKHPAGIIISNEPLEDICPLVYDKGTGERIVGFDMKAAEDVGLVKFDCLGITLLDKIHSVCNLLEKGRMT